jgi:hypothetical protein
VTSASVIVRDRLRSNTYAHFRPARTAVPEGAPISAHCAGGGYLPRSLFMRHPFSRHRSDRFPAATGPLCA